MKLFSLLSVICLLSLSLFGQGGRSTVVQTHPVHKEAANSGLGTMPMDRGAYQMPKVQREAELASRRGEIYTPFMLSLVAPLQIPYGSVDVGGLRLGLIFSDCVNMRGLDISLFGVARGNVMGLQIGGASIIRGNGTGWQANALANVATEGYDGLQIGLANYAGRGELFQLGVYNGGDDIKGLQLGLINFANEMTGMQIGLINVIQNKDIPFIPIINAYF